jgi:hypothetical protein
MYERSLADVEQVQSLAREQTRRASLRKSISCQPDSSWACTGTDTDTDTEAYSMTKAKTMKEAETETEADGALALALDTSACTSLAIDLNMDDDDDKEEEEGGEEEEDVRSRKQLQQALSEALSRLDAVCEENEKQSTIYSITRKEMFIAQEKVDELSYKTSTVEEMNTVLKANVATLSRENDLNAIHTEQLAKEFAALSDKFAVQMKLNTSLTAQLEKLEQTGIGTSGLYNILSFFVILSLSLFLSSLYD